MIVRTELSPVSLFKANEITIADILTHAATQLRASTDTHRLEAELLLMHALGLSRADLYAHPERLLSPNQLDTYLTLLDRRAKGEPLPYLIGHIEFYGLDLTVDPRVLIPRPETETMIDLALTLLSPVAPRPLLADVGTGSGCIAITLAVHAPGVHVYALDISPDALAVASANAERHGVIDRITFVQSDLLTALPGPVDLIATNPPYIAADEWSALPREIREHEPRLALNGGPDGSDVIRQLLDQAPAYLHSGGALLMEIGATQGAAIIPLAQRAFPAADITLHTDLAGRDRVLCIQTHLDPGKHSSSRKDNEYQDTPLPPARL